MTNVTIVGGGLTGGTLAYALAQKGLKVALVDQIDPEAQIISDGRSFALSRSSHNIFSKLGMWPEAATPITSIHTSDGVLPRWVDYEAQDVKGEPLGYVVDSALLKKNIIEKVLSSKNIKLYAPVQIVAFKREGALTQVETEAGECIESPLCIAADGKSSALRKWADIPLTRWTYDQVAIVCNMTHSRPHNYRGFEHFLPSGPLALVPRPGNESGLVWSIEEEKAKVLLSLSEAAFAEEVQAAFGGALGKLKLSSQRFTYPLGVCLPRRLIDTRLALVGDAAHTFHPVAGQGLNVGLRDVATLVDVFTEAFSLGIDLGSQTILKQYQRQRRLDIYFMALLMDGFVRVFSTQSRSIARMRSLGFGMVKNITPLKRFMIRHAMGSTGRVPYLARD